MASRLQDVIQRGLAASRPAATAVAAGTLYYSTDTSVTERSDGTNWQTYSDAGAGITELTGNVTAGPGSGSQVATIANDAVTFAKIQNITTDRLLGRDTAGSGDAEEISLSTGLEFTGGPGIRMTTAQRTKSIGITIDGSGLAIATGVKGYIYIPVAVTLTAWNILALDGLTGAIKIDVWMDSYTNFPPDNSDSITNGHEPEIPATGNKAQDNNISDWSDVTIPADSVIGFNVDSCTTLTKVILQITCTVD